MNSSVSVIHPNLSFEERLDTLSYKPHYFGNPIEKSSQGHSRFYPNKSWIVRTGPYIWDTRPVPSVEHSLELKTQGSRFIQIK